MKGIALLLAPATLAVLACEPGTTPSCPTNYLSLVASHLAPKVPLNTQASCSGYSSVPLSSDPQAVGGSAVCAADAADGACLACLRVACCGIVSETCGGLDPATCAEDPGVSACINGALSGTCAAACGGPS